ncbi:phosphatase PAP2 family protein [Arenibaculum pallidiluteum]|uniref:phosphatase PAP2 family protein n=1 Tax=Arenibaculum pallidiluteum TaxID=2812559 RepID=UPI001A969A9C|nr:phosphatase PAP2 family protein [Arenibaculum pallidiluteum]
MLGARLQVWRDAFGRDLGPLGVLFAALLGVLSFGMIAAEVVEGDTHGFDRMLLLGLRSAADPNDPLGPPWAERMAQDITSLGSFTVLGLVTLGVIGYLLVARRARAALLVLASIGGGMALSSLTKLVFERPRPDLVSHLTAFQTASFPSGHAMLSAVTYLTLGALLTRIAAGRALKAYFLGAALTLSLLVGSSRVYLGVHWPTDVLAGWCLGAAWAMTCWAVALWLQRRGEISPPE